MSNNALRGNTYELDREDINGEQTDEGSSCDCPDVAWRSSFGFLLATISILQTCRTSSSLLQIVSLGQG